MAPTTRNGSAPEATAPGSGSSGDSWDRSCWQAKNLRNGAPPLGGVVADRPAQHGIAGLERVEDRSLRRRTLDAEAHLALDARQVAQMIGKDDADHDSVWTSTDRTAGRSRTIGLQASPESAEA